MVVRAYQCLCYSVVARIRICKHLLHAFSAGAAGLPAVVVHVWLGWCYVYKDTNVMTAVRQLQIFVLSWGH